MKERAELPLLIKRSDAFTFVSDLCLRCAANYRCLPGAFVGMNKDEFLLALHHKTVVNDAMRRGMQIHEEFAKEIESASELTAEQYYTRLRSGEKVILKEVKSCLMRGYRGRIDILSIQRRMGRYFIEIQENKSNFNEKFIRRWFIQLCVYGMIYSSMDMNYIHGREWFRIFLPEDKEPIITVKAYLYFINDGKMIPDTYFCIDNKIQEWWMKWVYQVYRLAAIKRRRYMRRGLYMLSIDEDEPKPLFFGEKKLLRKTPPPLKPRNNFER